MSQSFLSDIEIAKRFGVSRTTIWRWSRGGNFPKPISLSAGVTRWRLADREEWENLQAEAVEQ